MIRWYLFRGTVGGKPAVWAQGPSGSPFLLRDQPFAGKTFEDLRALAKSPGYVDEARTESATKPAKMAPKSPQASQRRGTDDSFDWDVR